MYFPSRINVIVCQDFIDRSNQKPRDPTRARGGWIIDKISLFTENILDLLKNVRFNGFITDKTNFPLPILEIDTHGTIVLLRRCLTYSGQYFHTRVIDSDWNIP